MKERKADIEAEFGQPLTWADLPERKACRIQYAKAVDGYDEDNWPAMIDWLSERIGPCHSLVVSVQSDKTG